MDFLAIVSHGFYPTVGVTTAQRMASVVTQGLFLGPLSAAVVAGRFWNTIFAWFNVGYWHGDDKWNV